MRSPLNITIAFAAAALPGDVAMGAARTTARFIPRTGQHATAHTPPFCRKRLR